MSASGQLVAIGALLASVTLDTDPRHRPDEWPDDAVLGMLELFAEMQPLRSMLAPKSRVPGAIGKPLEQARKRALQEARPTLFQIYWRLQWPPRLEAFEDGQPVYQLPAQLARALTRLEVATHEWERLEETYLPGVESTCRITVAALRYQTLQEILANHLSSSLVLDPRGRERLRGPAWRSSPCLRRHLASALGAHLAHPTSEDRELLRALLREPDESTQTTALRALLRDLTPQDRRAAATAYLESTTRVGAGGEAFARRVLAGTLKDEDLATQEQRAEGMARRAAAEKAARP